MASFPPTFFMLGSPRSCISSVRAVVCSSPVFTFEPIKCAEDIFHCAALSLLPATLSSLIKVTRPCNHAHKHTYYKCEHERTGGVRVVPSSGWREEVSGEGGRGNSSTYSVLIPFLRIAITKDTKVPNAAIFTVNKEDHTLGNILMQ